jgi:hypothetical protein
MLKLDFDIIYDPKDYKLCWICNNELYNSYNVDYTIYCKTCKYYIFFGLCMENLKLGEYTQQFVAMLYNKIIISEDNNFIGIKFPINLDKCIDTINKLQILL